jgi:hypothetical protein
MRVQIEREKGGTEREGGGGERKYGKEMRREGVGSESLRSEQ